MKKTIFDFPVIGDFLLRQIVKKEGGVAKSGTLRGYVEDKYNVIVDQYTYGSCFDENFNMGGVKIKVGAYCSIAPNVHFFGANHPITYASMSPYFYNKLFSVLDVKDVERYELEIGNDVWIGYGVTILSGCSRIGNGAVIGAGSIITKDVDPYTVVGGNPAKVIRKRFNEETIEKLEKSMWWKKEPKLLYEAYDLIDDPLRWSEKVCELNKR